MHKNPVIIIETNNWYKEYLKVKEKFKINNPLIITSNGAIKRYQLDKIFTEEKPGQNPCLSNMDLLNELL